jgi:hypothetical protein
VDSTAQEVPVEIISVTPSPAGWFACYLAEYDAVDESKIQIATLPIMGWALVQWPEEEDPDISKQEIRPFVVHLNGDEVDIDEVDQPFICVVPPGQDPIKTARLVLSSEGTKIVLAASGLPS